MLKLLFSFILVQWSVAAAAQITPAEGSQLHYRLIGFSFPDKGQRYHYELEIATGIFYNEDSFKKAALPGSGSKVSKLTGEVPSWGTSYTWRVIDIDNKNNHTNGRLYHFSVLSSPFADTTNYRLRVKKPAEEYKDAYIFADRSRAMYNMAGEPLWYLPNIPGLLNNNSVLRDLRLTPFGTLTFVNDNRGYEISYDAKVLWSTPRNNAVTNDTVESVHHEMIRRPNGHYMALGNEAVYWEKKQIIGNDSGLFFVPASQLKREKIENGYVKMQFGTVVEYDAAGNVVWKWRSSDRYKVLANKGFTPIKSAFDIHENSFYFDETGRNIYVSFKNINRIFKVKYPEGSMTAEYGGSNDGSGDLFCDQHSCKYSPNGYLYLLNNNTCNVSGLPSVMLLQEPENMGEALKPLWHYDYNGETNVRVWTPLTRGGNVIELKDKDLFVSLCAPYANVFIVNRKSELLWDATFEQFNTHDHKWSNSSPYRSSIVEHKEDIERLIWGNPPVKVKVERVK